MDFAFTEEQRIFQKSISDFARKEIKPLVKEAEEDEIFPKELIKKMGTLGFLGIGYKEKYGGSDAGKIMECIFAEELGYTNSGITSGIFAHYHLGMMPICEFGSKEQINEYFIPALKGDKIAAFAATEPNAGSDVKGIETTARKHGKEYVLNGSKIFITNGTICDYVIVCAYTDKKKGIDGLNLFIVDKNTSGFMVKGHLKKAGNRSSDTAELVFDECRVSEAKLISNESHDANFRDIMKVMSAGRMVIAARGIGLARAALDAGILYSKQRIAFGKPISKNQVIAFRLAEMATQLELARMYVFYAAWRSDQGLPCIKEASMAKIAAYKAAVNITNEVIEIHGGYGVMREYDVSRYLMDAKVGEIGEGTPEIQNLIISRQLGL